MLLLSKCRIEDRTLTRMEQAHILEDHQWIHEGLVVCSAFCTAPDVDDNNVLPPAVSVFFTQKNCRWDSSSGGSLTVDWNRRSQSPRLNVSRLAVVTVDWLLQRTDWPVFTVILPNYIHTSQRYLVAIIPLLKHNIYVDLHPYVDPHIQSSFHPDFVSCSYVWKMVWRYPRVRCPL